MFFSILFADDGILVAGVVIGAAGQAAGQKRLVFVHIQFHRAGIAFRVFVIRIVVTRFALIHCRTLPCLFSRRLLPTKYFLIQNKNNEQPAPSVDSFYHKQRKKASGSSVLLQSSQKPRLATFEQNQAADTEKTENAGRKPGFVFIVLCYSPKSTMMTVCAPPFLFSGGGGVI